MPPALGARCWECAPAACWAGRFGANWRRNSQGVCEKTLYWVPVFGSIQNDGLGLEAARQRGQDVAGDVLLGEAQQLQRAIAGDVDVDLRIVVGLLDVHIHASNMGN